MLRMALWAPRVARVVAEWLTGWGSEMDGAGAGESLTGEMIQRYMHIKVEIGLLRKVPIQWVIIFMTGNPFRCWCQSSWLMYCPQSLCHTTPPGDTSYIIIW